MNDLRFGLRQLLKNPGFTTVATLTLAFGIGANTMIFAVIRTILFSSVMARQPEQLVSLYQQDLEEGRPGQWRSFSYPDFVDLRADKSVFADLSASEDQLVGVRGRGLNELVPSALVSANYFSLLGVPPMLGRWIEADEEKSPAPVAVLTHAFWERLGKEPAIIGSTLKLSRGFVTIVGVMPPGFTGDRLGSPALFLSLGAVDLLDSQTSQGQSSILAERAQRRFSITGRLKDGMKVDSARSALTALNNRLPRADPGENLERLLVCTPPVRFDYHPKPEQGEIERQALPFAALAQGMTLLVLFIVCLNLANMMLARGAAREKEIAIRFSLGGSRNRNLRQLLTEGLLLALLGGGAALLVSVWTAALFGSLVAGRFGIEMASRGSLMDWRLFGALFAFCLFATLFFALGPALRISGMDFNESLKKARPSDAKGGVKELLRLKNLVAIGQIALVMTMLVAAIVYPERTECPHG